MGNIRKTYSPEEKLKAVEMYLNDGMGYERVGKELDISHTMVSRWVKQYQERGIQGLQENRGKAKGTNKGRPRKNPLNPEEELQRLRAENEFLKKLLKLRKG